MVATYTTWQQRTYSRVLLFYVHTICEIIWQH